MKVDPTLRDFCDTDKQKEIFDAVATSRTYAEAANKTGVAQNSVSRSIRRLKARAAKQGYSPEHDMTKTAPDGFSVKGTSTLYGEDGEQKLQWVKTNQDLDAQRSLMEEAFKAMNEEIKPIAPKPAPEHTSKELLTNYVITDYHFAMYAWGEETRDGDWDVAIAEKRLLDWFNTTIQLTPDSDVAIFAQLGDFLHWDGMEALTPASKNILDVDSRYQLMVRIVIRVIRHIIDVLLSKHKEVHVIMAEGNHDPVGSIWLREWLHTMYEKEKRVTVDRSADPYYCYEFGLTSLFYHHGHKRKPTNIDDVWVGKFREIFGRTKFSYGHMGHKHERDVKETNLMVIEQHRTLANMDAYASRGGWISGKEAQAITYHQKYGEVSRVIVSPDMLSR